tara:strand:- start:13631 stop:14800 length:1170 start_codon:yes stop_codon:yes gene_type:complete
LLLDIIFSILIVLTGFFFINLNRNEISIYDKKCLKKLWVFHLIFSILYYFYLQNNSADATGYWRVAKNSTQNDIFLYLQEGPGTSFMYVLNYIPANLMDLSLFVGMLFYGLIGFLGLYYFYVLTIKYIPYNTKFLGVYLFPALFFLPNLHFWSAAVGKDTLMFFSIGLFCFSLQKMSKRLPLLLVSILIAFMVRPHVLLLLLVAFAFAYLFQKKIKAYKKVFLSLLLFGGSLIILPSVVQYVNLEEVSVENVVSYSETQAGNLSGDDVGSSVSISNLPFPIKILTFLFRPLFFDIVNYFSIVSSFENFILLLISIKLLMLKPLKTFMNAPVLFKGLLIFLILGSIIFSLSLSNLGIIIRMKNMFMPGFIMYILWAFSYNYQLKINNYNR